MQDHFRTSVIKKQSALEMQNGRGVIVVQVPARPFLQLREGHPGLARPAARPHGARRVARVYVRDALERWVPGATLVSLAVEQDGPVLTLRVRVRERETTATVDVTVER